MEDGEVPGAGDKGNSCGVVDEVALVAGVVPFVMQQQLMQWYFL